MCFPCLYWRIWFLCYFFWVHIFNLFEFFPCSFLCAFQYTLTLLEWSKLNRPVWGDVLCITLKYFVGFFFPSPVAWHCLWSLKSLICRVPHSPALYRWLFLTQCSAWNSLWTMNGCVFLNGLFLQFAHRCSWFRAELSELCHNQGHILPEKGNYLWLNCCSRRGLAAQETVIP